MADLGALRRSKGDILVVDDTAANLMAVEAALASLGNKLVFARSGEQALARLLDQDFALILLDVQMPGMDGYECARLIRSRDRSKDVPIIFITAFSRDESDVMQAYQLGAVDFLFKPINPDILRAKAAVFVQLVEAQERERERMLEDQRRMLEADALRRAGEVQRRAMADLAHLNEQLATSDRRKDEFLAILSHELRNPLAPIGTALELVRRHPDRPVPPRLLDILERQTRHLTRLVDDLLDISRINAHKMELKTQPLDLGEVVDEALVAARPQLDNRHHQVVLHAPDGDAPTIIGDRVRLVQVVINLLNNAARYTNPGGRVELAWGARGGTAFVRVSDNGRGISPQVLDRVFDLFVQERAGSDGSGGLGVGLSLVRRIAELHGGTATAQSAGVGHGATFELELPAIAGVTAHPAAGAVPLAADRALRTVIVDDSTDLRELIADLLLSLGHHVETAADGPSGLALIRAVRPDVALIDIGLPGLDGHAVARALRSDPNGQDTRLIAMTGYGRDRDRADALAAGFDVHLTKPATAETIIRALEEQQSHGH